MNNLKHTPGPWECLYYKSSPNFKICGIPKRESFNIEITRILPPDPFVSEIENNANARLIAAAPEMLEAIIEVIKINRQMAYDKYGNAENAMEWGCQKILIPILEKATSQKIEDLL